MKMRNFKISMAWFEHRGFDLTDYLYGAVLLNRGAHAPLWGEFEILRGEILNKGELGVNYAQRGGVSCIIRVSCHFRSL